MAMSRNGRSSRSNESLHLKSVVGEAVQSPFLLPFLPTLVSFHGVMSTSRIAGRAGMTWPLTV